MRKEANQYKLCTNDLKILETISLLNKEDKYPLAECVYLILTGDESEDVQEFNNFPTFKTLVSYPSKKVSRLIIMLIRYGYLERIYDEASDKLYLKVSVKGDMELLKYHKKHKYSYKKKQVKHKQLYAVIKKN